MAKPEEKLKKAVEGTGIAEVLQAASNVGKDKEPEVKKAVVQCRVASEDVPKWLMLYDFILQEEEEQDADDEKWSVLCAKMYVRHEGRFGFVWSISVSSRGDLKRPVSDVARAIRTISATLKSMPAENPVQRSTKRGGDVKRAAVAVANGKVAMVSHPPKMGRFGSKLEVVEMPLAGVTEERNKPDKPGGKGAKYIAGG